MPRLIHACLMSALLPFSAGAATLARLAELSVGSDDNISAAPDSKPREAEQFVQAGLGLTLNEPLAHGLTLRLLGRADGRLHAHRDGLNELALGGEGQLLLRGGNGFYAPTLGVSAGFGVIDFGSDLRDANEARWRLFARENLTTRLLARGSVFVLRREAESNVFDANMRGAELALDWQAALRLNLTVSYQYRDGEVASVGRPSPAVLANAVASAADDVFAGQTAFSFDAQTHIGTVAANYALTPQLALDVQLRYIESDPRFNSRYHRWTSLTGLLLRF